MEKIALHAYLMFEGNCREAMEFYQGIFGGNLDFMTYGDLDENTSADMAEKIMHSTLMGGEVEFMAGDIPYDAPLGAGKIHLSLSGFDEEILSEKFKLLSDGGQIEVPIEKQMWGDIFGAFTDKFGVGWMVNIRAVQETQI